MEQNNQVQANVEDIINDLTAQISQLTYDNSVLKSMINQYKLKVEELEQQVTQQDDNK